MKFLHSIVDGIKFLFYKLKEIFGFNDHVEEINNNVDSSHDFDNDKSFVKQKSSNITETTDAFKEENDSFEEMSDASDSFEYTSGEEFLFEEGQQHDITTLLGNDQIDSE